MTGEAQRQSARGPRGGTRVALAVVSGVATVAAFDPRLPAAFPVAWVALVPLFVGLSGAGAAVTLAMACSYAIVATLGTVGPWLVPAAVAYFDLGTLRAAAYALTGLAIVSAGHGLVLGALLLMRPRRPGAGAVVWSGALWVCWDAVRTTVFPYYPAFELAMSQYRLLPLIQFASMGGAEAITFLIVALNTGLAAAVCPATPRGRPIIVAAAVLAIVGAAGGWGLLRLGRPGVPGAGAGPRIALIDINAARWSASTLDRYLEASRSVAAGTTLLVWPESALTTDIEHDREAWRVVTGFVAATETPLLVGGPGSRLGPAGRLRRFNSAHLVRPRGGLESYHKRQLVPFAEGWPPLPGVKPDAASGVTAGDRLPVFDLGEIRFGVLICFEIADGAGARSLAQRGAAFIVNPTNDAWFTDEAPHFAWAVLRAVETGLPVVRAANAGTSAVIDAYGRIVVSRDPGASRELLSVQLPAARPTPYATRIGDGFVAACAGIVCAGALASVTRRWSRGEEA